MEKSIESVLIEFDAVWGGAAPDSEKQNKWRRELAERLSELLFPPIYVRCEFIDCQNEAEVEGWFRVLDFANQPTGRIQKMRVCMDCTKYLIGSVIEGDES